MEATNHGDEVMKSACEEVSSLVSAGLERKLSFRERLGMHIHFLMCAACKQYHENMLKLRLVLRMRAKLEDEKIHLPEEKREKIQKILKTLDS